MTDEEAQLDFDVEDIPDVPVKRGRGRPRRAGPAAQRPKRQRRDVASKGPQGPGSKASLRVAAKRGRPRKPVPVDGGLEEGELPESEAGTVAEEPGAGVASEASHDPTTASPTPSAHTASPARTAEIEAAGVTSPDTNSPAKPVSDPPSERLFDETDRLATSSHSESHKSPDAGSEYNDALDRLYLSASPSPGRELRSPEADMPTRERSRGAEIPGGDGVADGGSLTIEKYTMTPAESYRIRKRFGMARPDEIVIDESDSEPERGADAEKATGKEASGFGSWDVAPEPDATTNAWRIDTPEAQPDTNSGWGQTHGGNSDDRSNLRQSWGSKGRQNDGNNDSRDSNWNNNDSQGGYSNSRGGFRSDNGYRGDSGNRRGGFRGGRGGRGRGGYRNNFRNSDNRNNNEYDGGSYGNSSYGNSYTNSGSNNARDSGWGGRYDRPHSPQRGPSNTPPPLAKPQPVAPAPTAPVAAEPVHNSVALPSSGATQYAGADGVRYVLLQPEPPAYGTQQYLPMAPQPYAPQPFASPMHPHMPMMMPYPQPMMSMYGMPHMQYPDMYMMRGPAMPAPMPALMQSPQRAILQTPVAASTPSAVPSTPSIALAPVAPTLTPTQIAAPAATPSTQSANTNEASESLPAGWFSAVSKSYSGMRYYRNTVTGEKSWEVPTTAAVATGAPAYEGSRPHEDGYRNKRRFNDSDRGDFRRHSHNYNGGDRFNSRNGDEGPSGYDGGHQRRRVSNNYNENPSQGGKRNFTQPEPVDNNDVPSGW